MSLRMTPPPPPALRARAVGYALGAYKVFIERFCCRNFKIGSFNRKLKGLVPFVIVEKDWRATNPPFTPNISPNVSNENFEKVIFVQRS
jgi:hypothetical protein